VELAHNHGGAGLRGNLVSSCLFFICWCAYIFCRSCCDILRRGDRDIDEALPPSPMLPMPPSPCRACDTNRSTAPERSGDWLRGGICGQRAACREGRGGCVTTAIEDGDGEKRSGEPPLPPALTGVMANSLDLAGAPMSATIGDELAGDCIIWQACTRRSSAGQEPLFIKYKRCKSPGEGGRQPHSIQGVDGGHEKRSHLGRAAKICSRKCASPETTNAALHPASEDPAHL
jgi:hypothetical protein